MANAREQSIRQDAMAHGRIGSAQDMIARQQAAQAGANLADAERTSKDLFA